MEKIGRCFDETMADRFEHHRGDIIFFNRCSAAGIDRSAAAWIFLALCGKLAAGDAGGASLQFSVEAYSHE